ncbi:MAG TPA: WecB/TagA/CpsF family glycosyltransferase [Pararhizobium sp.]|uniref:WecB/TagA/CpsF family glycosyltransferase n=1 Tax=Pararhizobium sp. TaxID=1977563 RepID=UPI002C888315|nr:WecB/TagA/CpsF family glycosyltransferase [Pararhizobium sp.]HTO32851.1 WecB/TagA/CpsF family glycosyltransferase [Pararhizobium sp.]
MNVFPETSIVASQRAILDLPVCDFGWADAFAFADEIASLPIGQTVISFLNANNANLMMRDAEYRAVLSRQIVLPDGHGVDIASWLFHGKVFPANLNGTDFVPGLMTYMTTPRRVAMIGARADVLERAVEGFRKHSPWHEFIPVADGFFDESQSEAIMAKVRELKPDILLIAMGSPKQEKWIDRHVGPGHARLVISVGALFDFMAGEVPRASLTVRRLRLEWLHRLIHEPGRLWRRYLLGNPRFLFYILRHKLLRKSNASEVGIRRSGSRFF